MLDNTQFLLRYAFFDDSRETELSMIINGDNVLAFTRDGKEYTTRWNLDELAFWLRDFLSNMSEDPYPVEADGEYAAIKDRNAHEFDCDDEEVFDAYYDKLDDWNLRHRWHPASSGAILADVYFQLVGDSVEISWNNEDAEDGVRFQNIIGGCCVPKGLFISAVEGFLKDYALHWFS